jgi:lipopolysaccharide/colanic/teichoic acid biosynthesis glycosyltransferase
MITKRIFDLTLTIPGLLLLSPLLVVIALWIKLDSPGPVLFRQQRTGRHGEYFKVLKFRTMVMDAETHGEKITVAGDPRITRSGFFLRKYKLDELPQLFNVVKGEMSLVGPRPEVPEYVKYYPNDAKQLVLSVPPGITDLASIKFRKENELLASAPDPVATYINDIIPAKLSYYKEYVLHRSLLMDIKLIIKTIGMIWTDSDGK